MIRSTPGIFCGPVGSDLRDGLRSGGAFVVVCAVRMICDGCDTVQRFDLRLCIVLKRGYRLRRGCRLLPLQSALRRQ